MEVKWIEDLVALADSVSLTEAAERRNVTQPAFSRRIKAIESWLGTAVLDRTRKPVRLHPALIPRLDSMRALAADIHRLRQDVLDLKNAPRRIVIAAQHALTVGYLPAFIAQVQSSSPPVAFRLRSANRDDCYGLLMTRQADLIVAYETSRLPIATGETLIEKLRIGGDWLAPVAIRGFLPRKTSTRRAESTLKIVAYPRDVFFGTLQYEELLPALAPRYRLLEVCETALAPGGLQLALLGVGIAWVPRRLAAQALSSGGLVDLSRELGQLPLDIVVARLRTPRSRFADSMWAQFELARGGPPVTTAPP